MQRSVAISYGVFALLLILVAALGLGTPFIAAMFCYLALRKFAFAGRRWVALTLFFILLAAVFVGFAVFIQKGVKVFPEIAEESIPRVVKFAEQHNIEPPFTDMESAKAVAMDAVRDAFGQLSKYVRVATKEFVFLLIGIVLAVGIFLNPDFESAHGMARRAAGHVFVLHSPDQRALRFLLHQLRNGHRRADHHLCHQHAANLASFFSFPACVTPRVVIVLTFLCGLLPIVGNIISNTIIVCIAFIASPKLGPLGAASFSSASTSSNTFSTAASSAAAFVIRCG